MLGPTADHAMVVHAAGPVLFGSRGDGPLAAPSSLFAPSYQAAANSLKRGNCCQERAARPSLPPSRPGGKVRRRLVLLLLTACRLLYPPGFAFVALPAQSGSKSAHWAAFPVPFVAAS